MVKIRQRRVIGFITVISVALVVIAGVRLYNHLNPTIVARQTMLVLHDSLLEMEEKADLIVLVDVSGRGRQEELQPGSYVFNTFTPVKVKEIYKGDVNPGDKLEIAEHYGLVTTFQETFLYTTANYLPMRQGSTYLLFLTKTQSGWLRINGVSQGKFIWPLPKKLSAGELELSDVPEEYRVFAEEIRAKYGTAD